MSRKRLHSCLFTFLDEINITSSEKEPWKHDVSLIDEVVGLNGDFSLFIFISLLIALTTENLSSCIKRSFLEHGKPTFC